MSTPEAHPGKSPVIEVDGRRYRRVLVRTPIITEADELERVARDCALPHSRPGDLLFISEKVLAITQGRAIPRGRIRVSLLARLLCKGVHKSPYGVGLRSPYSMQCALEECGTGRILMAASVAVICKLVGRRGDFYRLAGPQAAAIDADGTAGIAQFRECVIKGPRDPEEAARKLAVALGLDVAIVDVNDLGSEVLGCSPNVDETLVGAALRDNPLGQGAEQTPMGLLRREATEDAPHA